MTELTRDMIDRALEKMWHYEPEPTAYYLPPGVTMEGLQQAFKNLMERTDGVPEPPREGR